MMRFNNKSAAQKLKSSAVVLICLCLLSLSFAGCKKSGDSLAASSAVPSASGESTSSAAAAVTATEMSLEFSSRDMDASFDEAAATKISFVGTSGSVAGSGASASGGVVTITADGTYIVSGTVSNGRIIIEAGDTDKIQLVLQNADITCADNAPIFVKSADKVFITLADGSTNSITDGESYNLDEEDSNVDAAIFSRADLTINGSGSLNITANYKHAVVSKDDLDITGGSITVNSASGGLYGKDCVKICGGNINITSGTDGIQASNAEDASKGYVYISDGAVTITAGTDGIQAETAVRIDGGSFDITTGGGSANASTNTAAGSGWGAWGGMQRTTTSDDTSSAKGIKSVTEIIINGGSFKIDSSDDSVHTNGDASITGGELNIASGDDGVHADSELVIDGGTIRISKSYEGLEALSITINGGDISVVASDDGINVAGGNDSSAMGGRPGQNNFAADSSSFLKITGGRVEINASGDGLDSNGNMYVSGGEIYVSGPTDSGNGAFDYDGAAEVTGGIVIAAGSTGMAQNFSSVPGQCSILYNFSSSISGGTEFSIKDESGNVIASFTPAKTYQSVVVTAPAIVQGSTYTLAAGSQSVSVTPTSAVYSNSGGGMSNPGGMGGRTW